MTGKKFRRAAAVLGLLALPVAVAAPAAAAAPSKAAAPSGPGYRVTCSSSHFYWCDQVSSTGTVADLKILNNSETGGHDVAYIDFHTNHCGQNLWILTSNGSGGWNWEGVVADTNVWADRCDIPTQIRSDAGVLIKLAVYNYDTGAYMYTNAH
ncbi:hypothetical protein ACIPYS_22295 [Kitasatospora sp. NPDC089913]|uniref:hypothetical protein n=1 Tax=Kitasatospora sp. NPDC089913 TaxID=3364080 RepID=UPI00380FF6AD